MPRRAPPDAGSYRSRAQPLKPGAATGRSRLSVAKGCGNRRPKAMPAASATAGDTKPLAEMMIERKKMRLALTGVTRSSVQRKGNELQGEIVMPDKVSLSARRRLRAP